MALMWQKEEDDWKYSPSKGNPDITGLTIDAILLFARNNNNRSYEEENHINHRTTKNPLRSKKKDIVYKGYIDEIRFMDS